MQEVSTQMKKDFGVKVKAVEVYENDDPIES